MYELKEVSGVFVDAAVKDELGQALFASLVGSDTELQALAGRLSLSPTDPQHIKTVSFRNGTGDLVMLSFPKNLEKTSQRMDAEAKMTGAHVFWYQKRLLPQYFDTGRGIFIIDGNTPKEQFDLQLWRMIKKVCRPPLMDHWQDVLQPIFLENDWVKPLDSHGKVCAYGMDFPDEHIEIIEDLVKQQILLPNLSDNEVVSHGGNTCH